MIGTGDRAAKGLTLWRAWPTNSAAFFRYAVLLTYLIKYKVVAIISSKK
jgi:hypothetical protein